MPLHHCRRADGVVTMICAGAGESPNIQYPQPKTQEMSKKRGIERRLEAPPTESPTRAQGGGKEDENTLVNYPTTVPLKSSSDTTSSTSGSLNIKQCEY
jgi:hypothetical protein